MSTDTPDVASDGPPERRITLTKETGEECWSAVDEELGVASQGETREEALANLDEAGPPPRRDWGAGGRRRSPGTGDRSRDCF